EKQRQHLREEILSKAKEFSRIVAQKRGVNFVLRADGAMFFESSLDVTDEVIRMLNAVSESFSTLY
ncbi:MAG: OmpH family outer membrane protein, partial [Myxococcota bacterium]